ncbi:MAG: uracil-DNA glycosylase, partial [Alicyclobacillaceae bacterium]|nr:uracil-DNA glycosylase [Alicyclobacillaceae bacterium]
GQLLDRMLKEAGFEPDRLYVTNAVKCRPPNNRKPTPGEIAACHPYLMAQLAVIRPGIVVTLGATAIESVLGRSIPVGRASTRWYRVRHREHEFFVAPCYHPSAILRDPRRYAQAVARFVEIRRRAIEVGCVV